MILDEALSQSIDLPLGGSCDIAVSQALREALPQESQAILEESTRQFPRLWSTLLGRLSAEDGHLGSIAPHQALRLSIVWVTNAEIHQLNREFREKDSATDVLTFSLLEEADMGQLLPQLPEVDLGEIYVSLPWALEATAKTHSDAASNFFHLATLYAITRVIHGCLHLLGVHHDTMDAYNTVVAHQDAVIQTLYA